MCYAPVLYHRPEWGTLGYATVLYHSPKCIPPKPYHIWPEMVTFFATSTREKSFLPKLFLPPQIDQFLGVVSLFPNWGAPLIFGATGNWRLSKKNDHKQFPETHCSKSGWHCLLLQKFNSILEKWKSLKVTCYFALGSKKLIATLAWDTSSSAWTSNRTSC